MADDDNPADARVEWLRSKVVVSLAKENDKKFDKAFYAEETMAKFVEFFDHEDKLVLVVNDNLKVDNEPPTKLTKGKHLVFWKVKPVEISQTNAKEMIHLNEVTGSSLHDFLLTLARSAHKAVVTAGVNKERWGDVAQREMLEHYNKYVATCAILCGQIKGHTRLPMPTDGPEDIEETLPIVVSEDGLEAKLDPDSNLSSADAKQKLSMLEGAVITWITQIKDVIRESPDDQRVDEIDGSIEHLTPDYEVNFWARRASHLNEVWDQINSPNITRVLDCELLVSTSPALIYVLSNLISFRCIIVSPPRLLLFVAAAAAPPAFFEQT